VSKAVGNINGLRGMPPRGDHTRPFFNERGKNEKEFCPNGGWKPLSRRGVRGWNQKDICNALGTPGLGSFFWTAGWGSKKKKKVAVGGNKTKTHKTGLVPWGEFQKDRDHRALDTPSEKGGFGWGWEGGKKKTQEKCHKPVGGGAVTIHMEW